MATRPYMQERMTLGSGYCRYKQNDGKRDDLESLIYLGKLEMIQ
ncbi:hypothetical protein QUF70_10835 [Desulfobacterales bacterium HSG17]|nr:hypothetical protein [Desulfobacterales bacterium HSG17]